MTSTDPGNSNKCSKCGNPTPGSVLVCPKCGAIQDQNALIYLFVIVVGLALGVNGVSVMISEGEFSWLNGIAAACCGGTAILFFLWGIIELVGRRKIRSAIASGTGKDLVKCDYYQLEPNWQESMFPIKIKLANSPAGIELSFFPSAGNMGIDSAAEIGIFHQLSDKNSTEPFTIPYNVIDQFCYLPYYRENSTSHILRLSGEVGFKGPLQDHGKYDRIKIVLIYRNEAKKTKIQLEIISVDNKDEDDPASTKKLYSTMLETGNFA